MSSHDNDPRHCHPTKTWDQLSKWQRKEYAVKPAAPAPAAAAVGFRFNDIGVCLNPEEVTYYAHPKRPHTDYCSVRLFLHPDTAEWMGAPSFMNHAHCAGHHGCPSKHSLQRFPSREDAERHYLTYMLSDQFKGLGGTYSDHNYLSPAARKAAEARLQELAPVVGQQLTLF
ncbi:hypothetical protein LJ737_19775 [Hymenobacter sp. 15J16-1T3B]|uniref:hypothetical protein n=1 Tax=Hymenobacter sp. 15J16-1T3B TaxID=2886941 RepID=UPI001D1061BD|nr:hypothetical protein [Hymenobacter sp. 15J16-1T3B]MCC3159491.1 hypothetical protein [Hymenobacter sp. 15J16-1T3B]